jgi:hypothetical protein
MDASITEEMTKRKNASENGSKGLRILLALTPVTTNSVASNADIAIYLLAKGSQIEA